MATYDEAQSSYTRYGRSYDTEKMPLGPRRPRQVTDYGSSLVQWMGLRRPSWKTRGRPHFEHERPSMSYVVDMLPPPAAPFAAVDSIPVRHLHHSVGKSKKPITVVRWTPEGRRLLTGGHTGEFMLWNGMAFNFETVMDAHYDQYKAGVTSAAWSWNNEWLVSGGQKGDIKYWRPNFNNVETIDDAHHDAVRDLAWSPSDAKFLSASDDTTLKIWDFNSCVGETTLTGHGWDIKSCDWHPVKGLLVSGSKDHQVKFWDPRTGRCLTTLHSHKNTVTTTKFSRINLNLLATSSRDQTARVFDLRMMRDICVLRGNKAPVSTLAWHPIHGNFLSTGAEDGALLHYLLDEPNAPPGTEPTVAPYDSLFPAATPAQIIHPAHRVDKAHDATIWSLDWHPLGHILASGSKDTNTNFWSRARPGETTYMTDVHHIGKEAAEELGTWTPYHRHQQARRDEEQEAQDEADGLIDQRRPDVAGGQAGAASAAPAGIPGLIPGIGAPQQPEQQQQQQLPLQLLPHQQQQQQHPLHLQQQQQLAQHPSLPLPPPPPLPGAPAMDPGRLAAMLSASGYGGAPGTGPKPVDAKPPLPPIPPLPAGLPPHPPPPAAASVFSGFPLPPPPPPGVLADIMPPGVPGVPGVPGLAGTQLSFSMPQSQPQPPQHGSGGGVRRRAPLPSQDEIRAEQKKNRHRSGR